MKPDGLCFWLVQAEAPRSILQEELMKMNAEVMTSTVYCNRMPQMDSLEELEKLIDELVRRGVAKSQVTLDLGLARGISYYTGAIFELMYPATTYSMPLGGGGRYDGLVKTLGGAEDTPTLGFAYNLDRVVSVLHDLGDSTMSGALAGQ